MERLSVWPLVALVVRNFGLTEQTLHNWVKAAGNGGLKSFSAPAVNTEQVDQSSYIGFFDGSMRCLSCWS